ncbi:MAG: tRNA preQ1(34) S-adenosylmethionine ribosyltransferase-isomerase QueA [Zetaproteobacteria bacterium]|nr:tRNA preQ1(34) S-adenosylmethionine ribosyltransferase-isomerase QueA [Pseudobdellovibrionaceae bacterium]
MKSKIHLQLSDFIYDLPEHAIAQEPLEKRDSAKLLVKHADGKISHKTIKELASCIPSHALLIVNETKVIPSRLFGYTDQGGRIEIMLLEQDAADQNQWYIIGKPMKKFKTGFKINFDKSCIGSIVEGPTSHGDQPAVAKIKFTADIPFDQWLSMNGYIPLPPYIKREHAKTASSSPDRERYQTVYAAEEYPGSAAAPTAGLHFTQEVFESLQERNIDIAKVTLHVGAGTFLPVKSENIDLHKMHCERYLINRQEWSKIKSAQSKNRPIIAVGTTTFRCIESFQLMLNQSGDSSEKHLDQWQQTDLFIRPKFASDIYQPLTINGIMTNFHQPGSTLLMLISSLLGYGTTQSIYKSAIEKKYRFLSYGDSSLLFL